MFTPTLGHAVRMSFQNIIRNKLLSIATVSVIAIMLFIFNILLAVQFIAQSVFDNLSQKIDLIIYLKDDIDAFTTRSLIEDLKKLEGVKEVTYTSKEEALEALSKNHPQTAEFFKKYRLQNPLPASIQVITTSPNYHENIEAFLNKGKYSNTLSNIIEEESSKNPTVQTVIQNLKKVTTFVNQVIFWIIIVFILGSALVIINAIHVNIFTKRMEISIMRLVGAKHGFIKLPFVLEGLWYSIAAVIISTLILLIVANSIVIEGTTLWSYYKETRFAGIYLIEILVTLLLGTLSSLFAAQRHIKGKLFVTGL